MVLQETKRKSDVNKILNSSLFLSNLWNNPEQLEDPKELEEFIQNVQDDSAEFRESARLFIENSNKFQAECRKLLAENDKHIEFLKNSKGVE